MAVFFFNCNLISRKRTFLLINLPLPGWSFEKHYFTSARPFAWVLSFYCPFIKEGRCCLKLQFNFKKKNIPVIVHLGQVEGEVMCNSIMAVAHGVMLTCDLVYNRCRLRKEKQLNKTNVRNKNSIWKEQESLTMHYLSPPPTRQLKNEL